MRFTIFYHPYLNYSITWINIVITNGKNIDLSVDIEKMNPSQPLRYEAEDMIMEIRMNKDDLLNKK